MRGISPTATHASQEPASPIHERAPRLLTRLRDALPQEPCPRRAHHDDLIRSHVVMPSQGRRAAPLATDPFGRCRHFLHAARRNSRGSAQSAKPNAAARLLRALQPSTPKKQSPQLTVQRLARAASTRSTPATTSQPWLCRRAARSTRCIRRAVEDVPGVRRVHLAASSQSLQA